MKYIVGICFVSVMISATAQELPFKEIPAAPDDFSSGSIVARMIDGLGYRYYWATEGLNSADITYKPSEESRDVESTVRHILSLSKTILNGCRGEPNLRLEDLSGLSFTEMRMLTLQNLQNARNEMLSKTGEEVGDLSLVFTNGANSTSFPFWNMINGPISDAIYHTGQIVLMRRVAGNPIDSGVNVLTGKTRN